MIRTVAAIRAATVHIITSHYVKTPQNRVPNGRHLLHRRRDLRFRLTGY